MFICMEALDYPSFVTGLRGLSANKGAGIITIGTRGEILRLAEVGQNLS
jgi:hypothetical protein